MTLSPSAGIALPLSAAQREIWYAEQRLGAPNLVYNTGEYVEIDGLIVPALFDAALRQVISEIDILHVRFVETDNGPQQIVQPTLHEAMPLVDLSGHPNPRVAAHTWMSTDLARPMV